MNVVLTFHVSLSFEDNEGITPTTAIFVTNNSYTLDRPKTLKFAPEIALGRIFWLESCLSEQSRRRERDMTNQTSDEQGLVRISHGFRVFRRFV